MPDRRPTPSSEASRDVRGPLLELTGVSARYGSLVAVRDVDLTVDEGEVVTLLGANGAGKSTTLGAIVGLVSLGGGRIAFDGAEIASSATEAIVRRGITLVPEGRRVFADLTVEENLRLGAATHPEAYDETLEEILGLFPIVSSKLGTLAGLLSGGEQQQVAIARALMSRPRMLLLDEPSLGLAPVIVAKVFELIVGLRERGITILLVEQNVERAMEIADRAYVLETGRIALSGAALSVEEIEDTYLGLSRPGGGSPAHG
jgi:branched-chain amino acid transport system ATP-binding protein